MTLFALNKDVLNNIKRARREGKVITASSRSVSKNKNGLNGEGISYGMVDGHVFSVLGVEKVGGKEMIKIRNPWGHGSMHYEAQKNTDKLITRWRDETSHGSYYITPERFIAYFIDYEIS